MFKFITRLFKKETKQIVPEKNETYIAPAPKPKVSKKRSSTTTKTNTRYVSSPVYVSNDVDDGSSLITDIIVADAILSSFDNSPSYSASDSYSSSSDSCSSSDSYSSSSDSCGSSGSDW